MPEAPHLACPACGCNRSGTPGRACPECGSTRPPWLVEPPGPQAKRRRTRLGILWAVIGTGSALILARMANHPDAQHACGVSCIAVLVIGVGGGVLALESWGSRPLPHNPVETNARRRLAAILTWTAAIVSAVTLALMWLDSP